MTVRLSIPCIIAGRDRRMGVLTLAAFVPSHTDTVEGMSLRVATMPTPLHRLVLTLEALSP